LLRRDLTTTNVSPSPSLMPWARAKNTSPNSPLPGRVERKLQDHSEILKESNCPCDYGYYRSTYLYICQLVNVHDLMKNFSFKRQYMWLPGKPVTLTWLKFKILSYLYQLKAYELRMKTQFKLW
jgi:hypothetical protein